MCDSHSSHFFSSHLAYCTIWLTYVGAVGDNHHNAMGVKKGEPSFLAKVIFSSDALLFPHACLPSCKRMNDDLELFSTLTIPGISISFACDEPKVIEQQWQQQQLFTILRHYYWMKYGSNLFHSNHAWRNTRRKMMGRVKIK